MTDLSAGLVLVIVAGVLGGLVVILGLIYTYIYCTKLRPRPRLFTEQRVTYSNCEANQSSYSGEPERHIKTHPFFIMHYMSKLKVGERDQAGRVLGSPRRH